MAMVAAFIPKDPEAKISTPVLPWFVIGFFGLAAINSLGVIPTIVAEGASKGATALLACAVTATGIRSNMQSLTQNGLRPLLAIVFASIVALGLSAAAAAFFIHG
jgi:uncharacterized membrane protein YadS